MPTEPGTTAGSSASQPAPASAGDRTLLSHQLFSWALGQMQRMPKILFLPQRTCVSGLRPALGPFLSRSDPWRCLAVTQSTVRGGRRHWVDEAGPSPSVDMSLGPCPATRLLSGGLTASFGSYFLALPLSISTVSVLPCVLLTSLSAATFERPSPSLHLCCCCSH